MKTKLKNLISGYEDVTEVAEGIEYVAKRRFLSRRISGSFTANSKWSATASRGGFVKKAASVLSYTSSRAYAALMLTFGVLTMLLNFAFNFFDGSAADIFAIAVGLAFCVLSIPMFIIDGPISLALQNNAVTDYIFFEFFCIKRARRDTEASGIPWLFCALIGALFAGAAFWLSTVYVVAVMCALVLIYLSFASPEFTLFAGLLVLPIMPVIPHKDAILAILATIMVLSFARKVAFGKRAFVVEQYDVILALMLLSVLISGIFLGGLSSFKSSLVTVCAGFGYFVTSSTVTNRRLAECMLNSIAISSVFCSVTAIVEFCVKSSRMGFYAAFSEGVSATLASAEMLAAFLLVSFFAVMFFIRENRGGAARFLYTVILLLNVAALVFCGSVMAYIALAVGFLVIFALKLRKWSGLVILFAIIFPYTLLALRALPQMNGALSVIFGNDIEAQLLLWKNTLRVIGENFIFGVGIGSESFSAAFTELGMEAAGSADNLFLGMAAEAGVISLILFVLLILIRLRHRAVYYKYLADSDVKPLCETTVGAVVALLVFGASEFIFADPVIFYLFFSVFGLGSAVLRISRENYDNKANYYHQSRRMDSAEIYVDLR